MTRLILWRHGRTEWNVAGRVQGHEDVDLDDVGVAQAAQAAPKLAAYRPDVIISSDLRRAARTAQALSALIGVRVDFDGRLRERHYGPWQGLDHAQIRSAYPEAYDRWGTTAPIGLAGIETLEDLASRVVDAMLDAAKVAGEGTAVLVTHGGSARAGCGALLGWPVEVQTTLGTLGNCHFAELRHSAERGWQLRAHNVV